MNEGMAVGKSRQLRLLGHKGMRRSDVERGC